LGYVFFSALGQAKTWEDSSLYACNHALVGFYMGSLLSIHWQGLALLVPVSALTSLLCLGLTYGFARPWQVPLLTLPFVLAAWAIDLIKFHLPNLISNDLFVSPLVFNTPWLPEIIRAFLSAVGALFFTPEPWFGLLICVFWLFSSYWILCLAIIGFASFMAFHGLISGTNLSALHDLSAFNSILVAIAIGAVYNLPLWINVGWAALAAMMCALIAFALKWFLAPWGLGIYSMPFVITVIGFFYVFQIIGYRFRHVSGVAGAKAMSDYFVNLSRFSPTHITLSMPVAGKWLVWQGFHDQWTHQGLFGYAYDLVKTDTQGATYTNSGKQLVDYYCFGQAVYSPVWGKVIKVIHNYPDHPIGSLDESNRWGNYVIIEDWRGFYVVLAHFSNLSIQVYEGCPVAVGTYLGLCGNSGYSPQPHLHFHVQSGPHIGSPTLPFRLLNYRTDLQYYEHGEPKRMDVIQAAAPQDFMQQLTTFVLDQHFVFNVEKHGKNLGVWQFTVKINEQGEQYFESARGRLFFGKREGSFYCYRIEGIDAYFNLLKMAMSTIPLHHTPALTWRDVLSHHLLPNNHFGTLVSSVLLRLLARFSPQSSFLTANYQSISATEVAGEITPQWQCLKACRVKTKLKLDPYQKILQVTVGSYVFNKNLQE
jgi:urea transporter